MNLSSLLSLIDEGGGLVGTGGPCGAGGDCGGLGGGGALVGGGGGGEVGLVGNKLGPLNSSCSCWFSRTFAGKDGKFLNALNGPNVVTSGFPCPCLIVTLSSARSSEVLGTSLAIGA